MPVPVQYHIRSLFRRRLATGLTVLAIACSVAVLVAILALAHGFEVSLQGTGRDDNLIVLRKGATTEGESGISRDRAQIVSSLPGIAKDDEGRALAGPELYAAVALDKADGGFTNIPFRGITLQGTEVQSTAVLGEGRWFRTGTREIVAGRSLVGRIRGCRLGGAIRFDNTDWPVVGIIDAPRQAWSSELWGDIEVMLQVFDRPGFNSVVLRVAEGTTPQTMIQRIDDDPRLQAEGKVQTEYYESQTGMLGEALRFLGVFLSGVMAIGSAFGATNTLLASLRGRRREIGTLLSIGYRPLHIYFGFLLEAVLLGSLGGLLGLLLALPVHGLGTGTTNWATFTEQAFSFEISPEIALTALLFGSFVGLFGGTLPAWRASRLRPTEALRSL